MLLLVAVALCAASVPVRASIVVVPPSSTIVSNAFIRVAFSVRTAYNASEWSIQAFATGLPALYPWLSLDPGA